MKMIPFDIPQLDGSFETFRDRINQFNTDYNYQDQNLVNSTAKTVDINNLSGLTDGRVTLHVDDIEFECLFLGGGNGERPRNLFVIPAGGIGPATILPHFERWSFGNAFGGACLYIEDPMYRRFSESALYTGWFYGHGEVSYLESVRKIVDKFAKHLEIDNRNIIFYGSSSGGYAVLYLSALTEHSKCISINPQINLKLPSVLEWSNAIQTQKILGKDFTADDVRNDLRPLVADSKADRTVILINALSKPDVLQCKSLCEFTGGQFPLFGLNKVTDKLLLWMYDAVKPDSEPHNAQENKLLVYSILNLLDIELDDFEKTRDLYLSITMLWTELYQQIFHTVYWMRRTDELKLQLDKLSSRK